MAVPLPPAEPVIARLRAAGCVFAEDEARLLLDAAQDGAELEALLRRRTAGTPLEHLLGWAQFRGLRVEVDPGVFVPRVRTGFLVEQAVTLARPGVVVLDLCCGCGAIGLAVAVALGPVELHAADVDPVAVRCARRNLASVGGQVHLGDLYAGLPPSLRGRVDVLVANVPYVPTEQIALMPTEARDCEPITALDGGADGLDVLRRVAAQAGSWLAPGGHLLIETSDGQLPAALSCLDAAGLPARAAADEELGATVVIGTRTGGRR
jgi:release factor glutamine methyltransferase